MVSTVVEQAHRQAVTASLADVAGRLQELLTRRLTAYIAGVDSTKTVARWANGETTQIQNDRIEQRLRTAYEIAILLGRDSPETVRAWFIGLNPQLGDMSPAEALHNDQLREVRAAARAFISGG